MIKAEHIKEIGDAFRAANESGLFFAEELKLFDLILSDLQEIQSGEGLEGHLRSNADIFRWQAAGIQPTNVKDEGRYAEAKGFLERLAELYERMYEEYFS